VALDHRLPSWLESFDAVDRGTNIAPDPWRRVRSRPGGQPYKRDCGSIIVPTRVTCRELCVPPVSGSATHIVRASHPHAGGIDRVGRFGSVYATVRGRAGAATGAAMPLAAASGNDVDHAGVSHKALMVCVMALKDMVGRLDVVYRACQVRRCPDRAASVETLSYVGDR
jgi:hypothetical protein